jgi:hypothetical protein
MSLEKFKFIKKIAKQSNRARTPASQCVVRIHNRQQSRPKCHQVWHITNRDANQMEESTVGSLAAAGAGLFAAVGGSSGARDGEGVSG